MSNYLLRIDLQPLVEHISVAFGDELITAIGDGLIAAATQIQAEWKTQIMHDAKHLWLSGKKAAANSIQIRPVRGRLAVEIYSDHKLIEWVENGFPERDLKRMLDTSMKVRVGKNGRRLIIPFRHNTPGNDALSSPMPSEIYEIVGNDAFKPSSITVEGWRNSGTGALSIQTRAPYKVRTREYLWGSKLPAGLAPKRKATHATDIYAGMRRFDTSSGKQKSSQYLTFRTMSEGSKGWIIPPKPGQGIAGKIASGPAQKIADNAIWESVNEFFKNV